MDLLIFFYFSHTTSMNISAKHFSPHISISNQYQKLSSYSSSIICCHYITPTVVQSEMGMELVSSRAVSMYILLTQQRVTRKIITCCIRVMRGDEKRKTGTVGAVFSLTEVIHILPRTIASDSIQTPALHACFQTRLVIQITFSFNIRIVSYNLVKSNRNK